MYLYTYYSQVKNGGDNIDRFEGCEINKLTDSITHKKGKLP